MRKVARQGAQRGLTLIEIMVVVAIIGMLAAMIVPNVIGQGEQAKVDLAKSNMASIASALDMFRLHNSRYPTTEEGLRALVERPSSARSWPEGGYLPRLPQDPWGSQYVYISPGSSGAYDLISLGADGVEGGEGVNADLNYRELQR
ncbi:general secretion pathway protein GspG [Alcanivorax sp. S71-1-4]|uniref:Type II secretion system core protein G n=1 Tax=Isoalcanivorax pacificus W11-5 TaxID=391936 RepID=A0A0B4XN89_9GAMM|nr:MULTISPECIES: type II secretion system major pseudopilin GspG [Alcanivoracaceae]AJD48230.1 general secretion pathway protein GspG [Isoalcanivorax pacificus W11-5]KAF0810466.1 general secretion pathway protein GspG [Alcanivorax sp. S71-1-4]